MLPLREIVSPSFKTSPVALTVIVPAFSLMSSSPQPQTQGFPHPRATTAACEVIPPLAVNTPMAAHIPPTSSGDVFSVHKMTFSPLALAASAAVDVRTMVPTAAPGPPARPTAITFDLYNSDSSASSGKVGCKICLMWSDSILINASPGEQSFSFTISTAI